MILPKEEREDRAVRKFLEWYNRTKRTSFQAQRPKDKRVDFICKDQMTGAELVIERTMLASQKYLKMNKGAKEFLDEISSRLKCKLPGVFLLHDFGMGGEIKYKGKTKKAMIDSLCQEILRVAPTLAEGEEAQLQLYQAYDVKLKKEEVQKYATNCALVYYLPSVAPSFDVAEFECVLNEADRKFANYTHMPTILLASIGGTGLDYKELEEELFQSVDMRKYPNIKHIYLSEGSPDPKIYHLWSTSA